MSKVGTYIFQFGLRGSCCVTGLQRVRDNLMAQLLELNKTKPRGKESEVLIAEISRLESSLSVVRDDLVCTLQPYRVDLAHVSLFFPYRLRAKRSWMVSRGSSSTPTGRSSSSSLSSAR